MPGRGPGGTPGRIRGATAIVVPDLGEAAWAAAIAAVESPRGIALRDLDEHLAAHPDALTSGDPRCPLALVQFTRALNAACHPAVVSPGCYLCGRDTVELPFSSPAGRSCRRCYIGMNKKPCARCGQAGKIVARRGEGGICQSCYRTDPQVTEECAGCGRTRRPAVRRPDGTALCESCWRPPVRTCLSCGAERPASLGADGAYCNTCYRRLRQPRQACGRCGLVRPLAARATDGSPGLCYNCNGLLPPAPCAICGKTRPGYQHAVHGFVCRLLAAPPGTLLRLRPDPARSRPLAPRPGRSRLLRADPGPSRPLPPVRHGPAADRPWPPRDVARPGSSRRSRCHRTAAPCHGVQAMQADHEKVHVDAALEQAGPRVTEEGGTGVGDLPVLHLACEPAGVGVITDHQRPLGHACLVPEPDLSSERNHVFQYRRTAAPGRGIIHPATPTTRTMRHQAERARTAVRRDCGIGAGGLAAAGRL